MSLDIVRWIFGWESYFALRYFTLLTPVIIPVDVHLDRHIALDGNTTKYQGAL